MSLNKNLDPKIVLDNLKDLSDIAQRFTTDMEQKNAFMKGGNKDCKECKARINKLSKRNADAKKVLSR